MANPAQASIWKHIHLSKPMASAKLVKRYLHTHRGPGKLTFGEFSKFGLIDNSFPLDRAGLFIGVKAQTAMHAACNDPGWFALSKNKLLWETYMKGVGLAVPTTLAAYDRNGRGGGVRILRSKQQLESFLCDLENLPVFCKPTTGVYSIGTLLLDRLEGNEIRVNRGNNYPVARVVEFMTGLSPKGYLFQQPINPHPAFDRLDGKALPTLRFLVFLLPEKPVIASVILKLGGAREIADNFWRPGAKMAALQIENGQIIRVVNGDQHSGASKDSELAKFEIPDYPAACALVLRTSRYFSGVTTQSWDVALSENGPVLLELNHGGDLGLGQLAHGEGVLSPLYCEHLKRQGYKGQLPD